MSSTNLDVDVVPDGAAPAHGGTAAWDCWFVSGAVARRWRVSWGRGRRAVVGASSVDVRASRAVVRRASVGSVRRRVTNGREMAVRCPRWVRVAARELVGAHPSHRRSRAASIQRLRAAHTGARQTQRSCTSSPSVQSSLVQLTACRSIAAKPAAQQSSAGK